MHKTLALVIAMLPSLGCVHHAQYSTFDEAGNETIDVELRAQGTSFTAQITFARKDWNATCPVLPPDTVLTVNGKVVPATSLGTPGSVCVVPEWDDDDPNDFLGDTVEVKLANSTGAVVARYVNVAVPRTFTVVQPQADIVHPGQVVTVKLGPGTDRFDEESLGIVTATFDKVGPTAPAYTWMDPEMGMGICGDGCADVNMITADVGTFVVPTNALGDVSLHLGEIGNVGTSQCDVAYCDFRFVELTNEVALQVTP
jgi:hypothetical protein